MKIDPKSIGVGQYQHDVHQPTLKKALDERGRALREPVGVELNTASAKLLALRRRHRRDAGAARSSRIATQNGPFTRRAGELLEVPRLGPKAFEQAAGFLRVRGGEQPARRAARCTPSATRGRAHGRGPRRRRGGAGRQRRAGRARSTCTKYVDERRRRADAASDIVAELEKPGRDPRASSRPPAFRDDVTEIEHLKPGMVLEGVVTNVTAFGAFVDIGVHQDGLVHVSRARAPLRQGSRRGGEGRRPREGEGARGRRERKRIGLCRSSRRMQPAWDRRRRAPSRPATRAAKERRRPSRSRRPRPPRTPFNNPFAAAFNRVI